MEIFLEPSSWMALLTLTLLEIVLGIDNIIFISIVSAKLPKADQAKTRNLGLLLALVMRIALLFGITWIIGFTEPLFSVFEYDFSGRDIILAAGGLFLIAKSTSEIHHKMEVDTNLGGGEENGKKKPKVLNAILQIIALDLIFSLDSILTAIGMVEHIEIMIVAVIISMIVMMAFAGRISRFINNHPTLQILALSFLILIGFMLVVEAVDVHVPKGYIYFAVFFSLVVETLNLRMQKKKQKAVD